MHPRRSNPCSWIILSALMAIGTICSAGIAQDELLAVSNGDHAWCIVRGSEPGPPFEIRYFVHSGSGLAFSRLQGVSTPPEELVAWRDELVLIFPPPRSAESPSRQVLSLRVVHNEPLDVYYALPRGRLRLEPSLPGTGDLISSIATDAGPIVLLADHSRRISAATNPQTTALPALLQLRANGWQPIDLPAGVEIDRTSRLAVSGVDSQVLLLLTRNKESADRTTLWKRSIDGVWSSESIELNLSTVVRITQLDEHAILAIAGEQGRIRLAYLRPAQTMLIADVLRPEQDWSILGSGGQLLLLREAEADSEPMVASVVDIESGEVGDGAPTMLHQTGQAKVWLTSIIVAAALSAVLVFALLRPIRPAPVTRERNIRLAPLSLRAAALLIDLVPATVPTILITGCSLADLVAVPLLVSDFLDAGPFFVMVGFMLLHTAVGEVTTGRTIGKYVMGIRIVGQSVDQVHVFEVLCRNLGKGLSLAVPPLVLLVAMNPNLQGLGDIMGRTLVVRPRRVGLADSFEREQSADDEEDDQSSRTS